MAVFQLGTELVFPNIDYAEDNGLLAIGGDLNTERVFLAYQCGIFPWYSEGEPILWWSPNPRFVLKTNAVHIPKSMNRILNNPDWELRINTSFSEVIEHCQKYPRKGQDGTWITNEMKEAYIKLFKEGKAFSFESWHLNQLVGGMYGVLTEQYFAGESMFSLKSNASKFALIKASDYLSSNGISLLDCQIQSAHLETLGAFEITRKEFRKYLSL